LDSGDRAVPLTCPCLPNTDHRHPYTTSVFIALTRSDHQQPHRTGPSRNASLSTRYISLARVFALVVVPQGQWCAGVVVIEIVGQVAVRVGQVEQNFARSSKAVTASAPGMMDDAWRRWGRAGASWRRPAREARIAVKSLRRWLIASPLSTPSHLSAMMAAF
jgi:hypothetical protein